MRLLRNAGLACLGAMAALYGAGSASQAYPVKPIRLIVPFVPGGGADTAARLFGARLSESLGQQIVIENRGGAGGTIGTGSPRKPPPTATTC
jgi:tripartite-type tricarboxylate transporter receptor subunit TctC